MVLIDYDSVVWVKLRLLKSSNICKFKTQQPMQSCFWSFSGTSKIDLPKFEGGISGASNDHPATTIDYKSLLKDMALFLKHSRYVKDP